MNNWEIVKFGIFDSKVMFPSMKETAERHVEYFEFEYMLDCDGVAIIDGKHHKHYPHSVIVRKPNQKCRSILNFRCLYFHLSIDERDEYYKILASLPDCLLTVNSSKYEAVFRKLIDHLAIIEDMQCDDFVRAQILELIYYIKQDATQNESAYTPARLLNNQNLLNALAYIETHYGENITLASLASVAGYSPSYFQRLFKKVFSRTPQEYLLDLRLQKSKQLLSASALGIAEICYACGFNSQSYFTLQFRKKYCTTPRKYRETTLSGYLL